MAETKDADGCCCPPGSEAARADAHVSKGAVTDVDGLNLYEIGEGEVAVIVLYDIFGFEGQSRIRYVCDQIAEAGYRVVLPDFYRGDWFDSEARPPLMEWVAQFKWEGEEGKGIKADMVKRVFPRLASQGVKKAIVSGFCWGAWCGFKVASLADEDTAGVKLVGGAHAHPSIRLANLFGSNEKELTEALRSPQYMIAAGNDPDNVKPGGEVETILKSKFGADIAFTEEYKDMNHGFVTRGDLKEEAVARDVPKATQRLLEHYKTLSA